ncbi:isochorismate synthase [Pseudomonas aeruginosa]
MTAVDLPALLALFEHARLRAQALQRPVLAVGTCQAPGLDPLQLYEAQREGFFWSAQQPRLTLFGQGCQWQVEAGGEQRLAEVQRQWQALCADALVDGPLAPLLLGGMRFDSRTPSAPHWVPFADASFHLAHWLVSEDANGCWLRCQRLVEPDSDPLTLAHASLAAYQRLLAPKPKGTSTPAVVERTALPATLWQHKVERALRAIDDDHLSKVVLARHIKYQLDTPLDSGALMRRLHEGRGQAHLFALHRDGHCFLGATPERLLSSQAGRLSTHALAGSVRRGHTPSEDQVLGTALLADLKERHEHQLVVSSIFEGLDALVDQLQAAPDPTLLKLANVQHLSTPIKARLRSGRSLLEGVAALHPTPAVGGLPRASALRFIHDNEGFDRGWYSAPVGWMDGNGNGDFLVALRCALLTPRGCHLFAGCGIVRGSQPANEYEETQIKLANMERALEVSA